MVFNALEFDCAFIPANVYGEECMNRSANLRDDFAFFWRTFIDNRFNKAYALMFESSEQVQKSICTFFKQFVKKIGQELSNKFFFTVRGDYGVTETDLRELAYETFLVPESYLNASIERFLRKFNATSVKGRLGEPILFSCIRGKREWSESQEKMMYYFVYILTLGDNMSRFDFGSLLGQQFDKKEVLVVYGDYHDDDVDEELSGRASEADIFIDYFLNEVLIKSQGLVNVSFVELHEFLTKRTYEHAFSYYGVDQVSGCKITNVQNYSKEVSRCEEVETACCKLLAEVNSNLKAIMVFGKYMAQAPTNSLTKGYRRDLEFALNNVISQYRRSKMMDDLALHGDPKIYACQGQSVLSQANCSEFSLTPTSLRLAYVMGQLPFDQLYKKTAYAEHFKDALLGDDVGVQYTEGGGKSFSRTTFLRHDAEEYDERTYQNATLEPFKVLLHSPYEPADPIEMNVLHLHAGMTYNVAIDAQKLASKPEIEDMEEKKGRCRKETSSNLKFFQRYSQVACLFECRLQRAFEECGCAPWDYPQTGPPWSICNFTGRKCFETNMERAISATSCGCLPTCSSLTYDFKVSIGDFGASFSFLSGLFSTNRRFSVPE